MPPRHTRKDWTNAQTRPNPDPPVRPELWRSPQPIAPPRRVRGVLRAVRAPPAYGPSRARAAVPTSNSNPVASFVTPRVVHRPTDDGSTPGCPDIALRSRRTRGRRPAGSRAGSPLAARWRPYTAPWPEEADRIGTEWLVIRTAV